jgi:saccharopine dehydrogenase (NAD+, L-lysine-forming)
MPDSTWHGSCWSLCTLMTSNDILVVGGYGEVGRRLAEQLEMTERDRVVVAGRHPENAVGFRARKVDVHDATAVDAALEGVSVVVACVRQREPHLLRAAVRRGIAYTSIAPPRLASTETEQLTAQARRTGARVILAAGLEPGISSVLARAAGDQLGHVDSIETALLLSLGDAYGGDSLAFLFAELGEPYSIIVDGRPQAVNAFERCKSVQFPAPVGSRRAYAMPFTDQRHYPTTLGAKTAVARVSLDPPWLGDALAALLPLGLRRLLRHGGSSGAIHRLIQKFRSRYAGQDRCSLVVDVRAGDRTICATLLSHGQATVTAVGAAAVVEALWSGEVVEPGVWLPEQVIAVQPFLARLAARGLRPTFGS